MHNHVEVTAMQKPRLKKTPIDVLRLDKLLDRAERDIFLRLCFCICILLIPGSEIFGRKVRVVVAK